MTRAFILGAMVLGVAGVAFLVSGAWLPGATYAALSLTWFLLARGEFLRKQALLDRSMQNHPSTRGERHEGP